MAIPNNPNDAVTMLWKYVQTRPTFGYLFPAWGKTTPISYHTLWQHLQTLLKLANLPNSNLMGWHSLRKSKAIKTFKDTNGCTPAVSAVLGHTKNSKSFKFYLPDRKPTQ